MTQRHATILISMILLGCDQFDQSMLDGKWVVEFGDSTIQQGVGILEIKNDTASIMICPWLRSEFEVMNLSIDSISLPTDCFDFRERYKYENKKLYIGNQFIATRIEIPSKNSATPNSLDSFFQI
jgi:hypothetical protein